MNQTEAKEFVYRSITESLRKRAHSLTSGQISMKASQKDVVKVKKVMEDVANQFARKLDNRRSSRATEAGQPGPGEGPDDLPKDGDTAAQGDAPPAAGEHQP